MLRGGAIGWQGGGCPSIIFKERKKRKKEEKRGKIEKKGGKTNKITKNHQNDLNAVYKWIKTNGF